MVLSELLLWIDPTCFSPFRKHSSIVPRWHFRIRCCYWRRYNIWNPSGEWEKVIRTTARRRRESSTRVWHSAKILASKHSAKISAKSKIVYSTNYSLQYELRKSTVHTVMYSKERNKSLSSYLTKLILHINNNDPRLYCNCRERINLVQEE